MLLKVHRYFLLLTPSTCFTPSFTAQRSNTLSFKINIAIGPYSQAMVANGLVFCSGQIPLLPNGELCTSGDIKTQTKQCLANLKAVLEASGSAVNKVIKVNVFLKDMNNFKDMNEVYADFFGDHKPARAAVEVARLPRDVSVEIECVAMVN